MGGGEGRACSAALASVVRIDANWLLYGLFLPALAFVRGIRRAKARRGSDQYEEDRARPLKAKPGTSDIDVTGASK